VLFSDRLLERLPIILKYKQVQLNHLFTILQAIVSGGFSSVLRKQGKEPVFRPGQLSHRPTERRRLSAPCKRWLRTTSHLRVA
jgi:hypothetical protein